MEIEQDRLGPEHEQDGEWATAPATKRRGGRLVRARAGVVDFTADSAAMEGAVAFSVTVLRRPEDRLTKRRRCVRKWKPCACRLRRLDGSWPTIRSRGNP